MTYEPFAFLVLLIPLVYIAYRHVLLRKKLIETIGQLMQSEIDKNILRQKISQINEDKKLVESEEFMQFLNTTRDAAFTYIEDVQETLSKYDSIVAPILEYNATYGMTIQSEPFHSQMMRIMDAHKDLRRLLPDSPNN